MAEKKDKEEIKDFLINASKQNPDLRNYGIYLISKFDEHGNNYICELNAVDVPIKREHGHWIIQKLFGERTIKGREELDKVRRGLFPQDLKVVIKETNPKVTIVFPETYDDLPAGFKNSAFFGELLQIGYQARTNIRSQIQKLKQEGRGFAEINQIATESILKQQEIFGSVFKKWAETTTKDTMKEMGVNPKQGQQPQQGYY